jgi:hypothetical protein
MKVAKLLDFGQQERKIKAKLDHPNVTKFVGASLGTSDLKIP